MVLSPWGGITAMVGTFGDGLRGQARRSRKSSACSSSCARMPSSIVRVVAITVAEELDELAVRLDRDALGDEVLADHVLGRCGRHIFGVRALGQRGGVEVGLAAQLHDAFSELVGVGLLFAGVVEKVRLDRLGNHPGDAIGVPQIAQHADPFGRQRASEMFENYLAVFGIGPVTGPRSTCLRAWARRTATGVNGGLESGFAMAGSLNGARRRRTPARIPDLTLGVAAGSLFASLCALPGGTTRPLQPLHRIARPPPRWRDPQHDPQIRDAFWHALAASPIMMVRLAAAGSPAHPMTAQLDRDADGCIWFFMNRDNTLAVGGPAHADLRPAGTTCLQHWEAHLSRKPTRLCSTSTSQAAWRLGSRRQEQPRRAADALRYRQSGNLADRHGNRRPAHRLTGAAGERGEREAGSIT